MSRKVSGKVKSALHNYNKQIATKSKRQLKTNPERSESERVHHDIHTVLWVSTCFARRTRFFSCTLAVVRAAFVEHCDAGNAESSRTNCTSSVNALRLPYSRLKASWGSSESRPRTGVEPVFLSGLLLRNLAPTSALSPVAASFSAAYVVRAGRFGFCRSTAHQKYELSGHAL